MELKVVKNVYCPRCKRYTAERVKITGYYDRPDYVGIKCPCRYKRKIKKKDLNTKQKSLL